MAEVLVLNNGVIFLFFNLFGENTFNIYPNSSASFNFPYYLGCITLMTDTMKGGGEVWITAYLHTQTRMNLSAINTLT